MRSAKAQDYWRHVYDRPSNNLFLDIDLNGLNGIGKIVFPRDLLTVCGLNGAGKSTIVSALKDIIGLPLSSKDLHKLKGKIVSATVHVNDCDTVCSNTDSNRLVDKGFDISKAKYLDFELSTSIQSYMIQQTNLEEALEQYEEFELKEDLISEISYLVGKEYTSCGVREFDDIDGYNDSLPFFKVSVGGEEYDSTNMGTGEHFLLYLFWCINKADKGTIIIVEEPETFISISSQVHFADFLAEKIVRKGLIVILTTHSPYILNSVKNESVRIVSRHGKKAYIDIPDQQLSVENVLGIADRNIGIFFVEDKVAEDFLAILLNDRLPRVFKQYSIESVGGESHISERLKFPKSDLIKYRFVGIYDGDMKESLKKEELKWDYCFLPGTKAIEEVFRDLLQIDENLGTWCAFLGIPEGRMATILATHSGLDCHDWFNEMRKSLSMDGRALVNSFYQVFFKDKEETDKFIDDLQKIIE